MDDLKELEAKLSEHASRVKEIGEEELLFLRYSHTAAGG